MAALFFVALMLVSLAGYGVVVGLSLGPLDPRTVSRGQVVVFVVYGAVFYAIATFMHLVPLFLFDTALASPRARLCRRLLFVLPSLMLAYMAYVMAVGR